MEEEKKAIGWRGAARKGLLAQPSIRPGCDLWPGAFRYSNCKGKSVSSANLLNWAIMHAFWPTCDLFPS